MGEYGHKWVSTVTWSLPSKFTLTSRHPNAKYTPFDSPYKKFRIYSLQDESGDYPRRYKDGTFNRCVELNDKVYYDDGQTYYLKLKDLPMVDNTYFNVSDRYQYKGEECAKQFYYYDYTDGHWNWMDSNGSVLSQWRFITEMRFKDEAKKLGHKKYFNHYPSTAAQNLDEIDDQIPDKCIWKGKWNRSGQRFE